MSNAEEEKDDAQAVFDTLTKWGVGVLSPKKMYTFSGDPQLAVNDMSAPKAGHKFKPSGVWYSPGMHESWLDWCVNEGGYKFLKRFLYELELDYTNILRLRTPTELFRFTDTYGIPDRDGWEFMHKVDWRNIWEKYDGLEIVPYQWACRLEPRTHWYYGWDCSSGCVWRTAAVKSITLVGENPKVEKRNERKKTDE